MPRQEPKRLAAAAGGILGAVLQGDGSDKATSHPPPKQGATYPTPGRHVSLCCPRGTPSPTNADQEQLQKCLGGRKKSDFSC